MQDASTTYLPVGNGDTSLIRLTDGTSILIDCNIRAGSTDSDDVSQYDVRSFLLRKLERDSQRRSHLDVFILTHPDEDHCRGIGETFYLGDPAKYSDDDQENDLILIDEMWFAPRIFNEYTKELSDAAKAFRKEAKRRMRLYKSGKQDRSNAGNRLRVIGYSENEELEGLEDILTIPGDTLNLINGYVKDDFRFFIYAPIKRDTDAVNSERNRTSIVLQARFDVDDQKNAALAFFGGDANCAIWERVVDVNPPSNLAWDLFLAPHHCSWYFFSEEKYEDNPQPSKKIMELLGFKREGAMVIASCKPIKDDDDNPPHYEAKRQYEAVVGDERFFCTSEYPSEEAPKPLVFVMSSNGPVKDEPPDDDESAYSAAVTTTLGTPRKYG